MTKYWLFIFLFFGACLAGGGISSAQVAPEPPPAATPATPATSVATPPSPAPATASATASPAPAVAMTPAEQREIEVNSITPDETIGELQARFSSVCMFCPMVGRIFASAMLLGERVFVAIAPDAAQFLVVALAIWVLWQAGKLLFPFMPMERGSVTGNTVLTRIVLGIAASAILLAPGGYKLYWDNIYMPVVDGAITLSGTLLDSGMQEGTLLWEMQKQQLSTYKPTQISGLTAEQTAMKDRLELQIYSLQNAFTYGFAVGVYLLQSHAFLTGLILIAAYIAAPLMFVMLIISSLLHWTFLSVLSPLLIAAAVFPKTRTYTISAIKQLLGSGMALVTASIVAVLSAGMVMFSIQSAYNALDSEASWGKTPEWLRLLTVKDPYSETGGRRLDGSATTPEGAALLQSDPKYLDALKSGLVPLPYRDTALAAVSVKFQSPPAPGACWKIVTSNYGYRVHPIYGDSRLHAGIDLGCGTGVPYLAVLPGRVIAAGPAGGCGNVVEIDHGNGIMTRNCHNSQLFVRSGQNVVAGQRVSNVGATGGVTGPHIHFELYINGKTVDPAPYLFNGLPVVSNGNYNYASGDGGPVNALSGYADFAAPLDFTHKATWQILLAAIIPWMLIRSVPQAFNSVLGMPQSVAAAPMAQIARDTVKTVMGVTLAGVTAAGEMLQKQGDSPPDRSDDGTSSTAIVVLSDASRAAGGGVNRDPQEAASSSDTATAEPLALPSAEMREGDPRTATIDVEAVTLPDDDRMPVMPTQKMTDRAGDAAAQAERENTYSYFIVDGGRYALAAAENTANTEERTYTFAENLAFYAGSAMLGAAAALAAVGRVFGVRVASTDQRRENPDEDDAQTGDRDDTSAEDDRSEDRSVSGGVRDGSGEFRKLEAQRQEVRERQEEINLEAMRRWVQAQQQNLATLIKAAAANDPAGKHKALVTQAEGLASATVSNRDLGDLYSLLAAMKNLEAPLNGVADQRKPSPTGGGAPR